MEIQSLNYMYPYFQSLQRMFQDTLSFQCHSVAPCYNIVIMSVKYVSTLLRKWQFLPFCLLRCDGAEMGGWRQHSGRSSDIISQDVFWMSGRLPSCCPRQGQHGSLLYFHCSIPPPTTPPSPCARVQRKLAGQMERVSCSG